MSNSKLVTYTKLSPNHSGKRTMAIDRITPHCVVGQLSAAGICGCFTSSSVQASCNYGIGTNGDIGLCVDEGNRSWCTSSNANDQRAVTIECASDTTHPYAFTDKCYQSLIKLCVDICKRNGKKKLLWFGDKNKTLNYSPKSDEMILTVHRWFAAKACPGDWMYSRMGDLANKVTAQLSGSTGDVSSPTTTTYYRVRKSWNDPDSQLGAYEVLQNAKDNCPEGYSVFDEKGNIVYTNKASSTTSSTSGTQSSQITGTEKEKAAQMLEIVHKCDKSGILYSVTTAQMILESGYCTTELSKKANNCFGMKCTLSGNSWSSVWDGKSKVNIRTPEQDSNGNQYYIYADFRKYPCIEDSIRDHACYLLGAMNGSKKRYAGLTECKDYKSAITLIKNGGYATDVKYISKICDIITRFKLYVYDSEITSSTPSQPTTPTTTPKTPYRVATSYSGGKYVGQVGAYDELDNAKKMANEASQSAQKAYYVYDNTGAVVYTGKISQTATSTTFKKYQVRVAANDLRIRKDPNGDIKGYIKPGVYTIVDEKVVGGLTWGKLLSGEGWIALKYTAKC